MGGFGSSRWGWTHTRATTDGLLRLDVRDLARRGLFGAGPGRLALGTMAWTRRGEPAGEIGVEYAGDEPGAVVLDYQVRRAGGPWERVRERVPLDRTPCRYGGARPWFLCPGCGGRRAVLYCAGGLFRCRGCHGLAYASTREADHDRAARRADRLRARLGCEAAGPWLPTVPQKPRGMRWRTFARLARELRAAEGEALAGWTAHAEAFLARVNRKHSGLR